MGRTRKRALKEECLVLKKLGPIEELELEPRDLTIIIGEQATGKSLVAQMLYFFRGLKDHLREAFKPGIRAFEKWPDVLVRGVLDDLRGVAFGYFANGTATIKYERNEDESDWSLSIYSGNRMVNAGKMLRRKIEQWLMYLDSAEKIVFGQKDSVKQVYIPTERSMYTRYAGNRPSVLFEDFQPLPFRRFADTLQGSLGKYAALRGKDSSLGRSPARALRGEAYVPRAGPKVWKWKTNDGGRGKILPIEAIASGQMEAWPFFVVAEVMMAGNEPVDFYFEEPETHLHPKAQVAVMDAVVRLVNAGHRMVVTTHSPYILYRLNNLLQRHQLKQKRRSSALSLDPERLCAIRMGGRGAKNVLDRGGTDLIDANELERVADELGGEFDRLLDESERK